VDPLRLILICGENARKRSTPKSASSHEKSITDDVAPEDYAGVNVRLVYRTVVRGLGERASRNRSAITLSLNATPEAILVGSPQDDRALSM